MKRLFSGLLALILTVTLLGCGTLMPEQTVICGELTVTLPASFVDLSDQSYAQGLQMVFGSESVIISASKESRAELEAYLPGIDAAEYARLAIQSNGLDAQVQTKDGIPTFTYTMGSGENSFTYLAAVFASEKNFWLVQCYCPAGEYALHKQAMWNYISAVQIR